LWLATEIDADNDLIVRRTPALQDVEGVGPNTAEVNKHPSRLVDIDHLLDPVRAGDGIILAAALNLADLPA
jgi:hypothetical protein